MTQTYIGVKIITAWPEESDGKPGYAVKYADGYTSWSPKDVFEEAYLPALGKENSCTGSPHAPRDVRVAEYTVVKCKDLPKHGGACHKYHVFNKEGIGTGFDTFIEFQDGPIQEKGVNGAQNEDLLAIVIDRLRGFQSGAFACLENENALLSCINALNWLEKRTADRKARGVEGKSEQ